MRIRFKKFIILPILFLLYIYWLVPSVYEDSMPTDIVYASESAYDANILMKPTIYVSRSYYGIRLPTYTSAGQYIGDMHSGFFILLFIMIVSFSLIETYQGIKNRRNPNGKEILPNGTASDSGFVPGGQCIDNEHQ